MEDEIRFISGGPIEYKFMCHKVSKVWDIYCYAAANKIDNFNGPVTTWINI